MIVTNFWDPEVGEREAELGKRMADSAKQNAVKHLIYSTLPRAAELSGGKYKVSHFDAKANVEDHIEKLGLDAAFLSPAFYYQNWLNFFPPRPKEEEGSFEITLPISKESYISAVDVMEVGKVVVHMMKNWDVFKGKVVRAAGDNLHPQEFTKLMADASGLRVTYNQVPNDQFKAKSGEHMTNMLLYIHDFNYYGGEDWSHATKLVRLSPFQDWVRANSQAIKAKAKQPIPS